MAIKRINYPLIIAVLSFSTLFAARNGLIKGFEYPKKPSTNQSCQAVDKAVCVYLPAIKCVRAPCNYQT